jgi:predicted membrane protein
MALIVVGIGAIAFSAWELALGLRRGRMRTIAHFSPSVSRAERPTLFWLQASLNAFVIAGVMFALVDLSLRRGWFTPS